MKRIRFVALILLFFMGCKPSLEPRDSTSDLSDVKRTVSDVPEVLEGDSNPDTSAERLMPVEYAKLLKVGMDVDWAKTGSSMAAYTAQSAADFKTRGFSHVRIRIKDAAEKTLLDHVERIVKDCLNVGLIPIIAYQGAAFKDDPSAANRDKIVAWWKVLSTRFKDYPSLVSFDLIIEVTNALNKEPEKLNDLFEHVVTEIRKTNPNRILFISPRVRSAPEYLKDLKIPREHNNALMVEWHFYASGPDPIKESKKWTTGTPEEKAILTRKFDIALAWQKEKNIPTWVGAWMPGNYNKGDNYSIADQVAFARFVSCELKQRGFHMQ